MYIKIKQHKYVGFFFVFFCACVYTYRGTVGGIIVCHVLRVLAEGSV